MITIVVSFAMLRMAISQTEIVDNARENSDKEIEEA